MKTLKSIIVLFALLAITAVAQNTDILPVTGTPVTNDQNIALNILDSLSGTHAWIATLLVLMGACRAIAKPLSSIVHTIVDITPSTWDNGALSKITNFFLLNPVGKTIAYVLDWLTSIKIKPPAK
jgi:uncharacterized Fe-S cluster-containing radical SAM superfamily protein